VDIFNRSNPYLIYSMIRLSKVFGRKIAFWTVNTDGQFQWIKGISDIIITDEVARILKMTGRGG
jgi:hypothetical protein